MIANLQIQLYLCSIDLYSLPTQESFYLSNKLIDLMKNQQLIPHERIYPRPISNTFCSYVPTDDSTQQSKYNQLIKFQKKINTTQKLHLNLSCLLKTKNKSQTLGEVSYSHTPQQLNSRIAFKVRMITKYKVLQMDIILKTYIKNIQYKGINDEHLLIKTLKQTITFLNQQLKHKQLQQRYLNNETNTNFLNYHTVQTHQNTKSPSTQKLTLRRKLSKINLISNQAIQQLRNKINNLIHDTNFQFECDPLKYFQKILSLPSQNSMKSISYKIKSLIKESQYQREDIVLINQKQKQRDMKLLGIHLIIFVHGLNGSNYDLKFIKEQMMIGNNNHKKIFLSSKINQTKTDLDIGVQGKNLARQIQKYIQNSHQIEHISFVSHSLGGLVVRAALPELYKYAHKMHSYITLSTPHFGFIKNSLLSFGLRLIGNSSKSIDQLLFQDEKSIQDCYIYRLASFQGLNWFKILVFFSSKQDKYVQYQSSKAESQLNDTYSTNMQRNMFKNNKAQRLVRVSVDFNFTEKSFDDFIGRTAHLKFLQDKQFANKFVFIMNTLWDN